MMTDPMHNKDLVEIIARTLFDAEEDLNDLYEKNTGVDLGPRQGWHDPDSVQVQEAFRHRARAVLAALRGLEIAGRVALPSVLSPGPRRDN